MNLEYRLQKPFITESGHIGPFHRCCDWTRMEKIRFVCHQWWEEKFHFMVSKQNWRQIIKHYSTYREKRRCKPSECTSGLDGVQSIVSFSTYSLCLVIQQDLRDEGNDNSRQCTMHSSVCFNIWIWQECLLTRFEMHENHRERADSILGSWKM